MQAESLCEGFEKNQKCVTDCLAKEIAELKARVLEKETETSDLKEKLESACRKWEVCIGTLRFAGDYGVLVGNMENELKKIRGNK